MFISGNGNAPSTTKNGLGLTVIKTVSSIIVLLVLVYLGKHYLKNELEYLGHLFFEKFGFVGLFIDVYLVDTFIVPVTPDLFLGLLITNGGNQILGLILICIASVLGGISGFYIGFYLNSRKYVQKLTKRYRERGERLFRRYGVGAVILAAISPIPFSTICWLAGIFRMRFSQFFWATFFRIPRMIIWYYLIAVVWQKA